MRAPFLGERPSTRRAGLRIAIGALVAGALALTASLAVAARPVHHEAAGSASLSSYAATSPAELTNFRMIEANLASPNTTAQFRADMRTLMAQKPDLLAYNEVSHRTDADLMPAGYSMWRTPGRYTGEAAVGWRTDRWIAVAQGTKALSEKHGIPKGKQSELGMRYANWVTLVSPDGRVLSLVSAHLAYDVPDWPSLVPEELGNLNALNATLLTSGPVLIAGDFNFHYNGAKYPRQTLAAYNMVPTYDILGQKLVTGDHKGATIDYTFVHQSAPDLVVNNQFATSLNSDHNAVTTDWSYGTPSPGVPPVTFTNSRIINRPAPNTQASRLVIDTLRKAIKNAPAGSALHLTSTRFSTLGLRDDLLAALKRGVTVQVILRNKVRTSVEKSLRASLGTITPLHPSGFVQCNGRRCLKATRAMGPTNLLVSRSGYTAGVRMIASRPLNSSAQTRRTVATVTVDLPSYKSDFNRFFAGVAAARADRAPKHR